VSVSSPLPANNGSGFTIGSSNIALATNTSTLGTTNNEMQSDGTEQFKGSHARANLSRNVYSSGGLTTIGANPEMHTTAHPSISGQVSPHSSSSHYLQAAAIKSVDTKPASGK
jgi:hypothetical protein